MFFANIFKSILKLLKCIYLIIKIIFLAPLKTSFKYKYVIFIIGNICYFILLPSALYHFVIKEITIYKIYPDLLKVVPLFSSIFFFIEEKIQKKYPLKA